ncbi:LysR family transcriptional regulator [Holophaga foetida]|uniref:LysR family transcriptional regulator n=1 Tax=Holophaga foetida TaxID=35839 RepID=UPI00024725EA|nr:LysR family transcriptional regulator [Holophaga foetida]
MDTRYLRCFMAVAEHLNLTKAAHQLCLTQSAVSYQITALEREMDVKLFERAPNSVKLTHPGLLLKEGLKGVMDSYDDLVASVQRAAAGATKSLSIGFLWAVKKLFLPPIIKGFRSKHPDVFLQVNHYDLVPLALALEKDDLDIAFTLAVGLPNTAGISTQVLFSERVVVVMAADHPLAQRESLSYADLKGVDFVDILRPLKVSAEAWVAKLCAAHGYTPRIVERFPDMESLFLAVELGAGVAVFPRYRAEAHASDRVVLVDMVGEGSTSDFVVAWKQDTRNPAVHAFLAEMGVNASPPSPSAASLDSCTGE